MSGKGCKYCPVARPCTAFQYRGSGCAVLRAEAGVFTDPDQDVPVTYADRIRSMKDDELAKCLAKFIADYTSLLYDGDYTPSDEAICEITNEMLKQLQQPYIEGSPTVEKGSDV